MKAMILAAGRGERMKPLTDNCPKPLLKVLDTSLIDFHILKLADIGITDIVINLAWLGDKIIEHLQNGERFGVNIQYSWEREGALETAGGIMKALPLLNLKNDEAFLVVNGDVFIDYDFSDLPVLPANKLAHLWLTNNPEHNLQGDFCLLDGSVKALSLADKKQTFTFSGIGLYRPSIFNQFLSEVVMPLAPVLRAAIASEQVSGSLLPGLWTDVGTPERLSHLNASLQGEQR